MATTRFNNNILEASRRVQQLRTSAGADGDTGANGILPTSSALWTAYENRAVRDLIREIFEKEGAVGVYAKIPQYVLETTAFAVTTSVALNADQWHILELTDATKAIEFYRLKNDILKVLGNRHGTIIPSATRPVYWEEAGSLFVAPAGSAFSCIARYLRTHQDITVNTAASDAGNFSTGTGSYTASTKTLAIAMNANFVSTDINKRIFFRSAANVYAGIIDTVPGVGSVTLRGDGLPTGTIAGPGVIHAILSSLSADPNDLILPNALDGEIIDRMVALARTDAGANSTGI